MYRRAATAASEKRQGTKSRRRSNSGTTVARLSTVVDGVSGYGWTLVGPKFMGLLAYRRSIVIGVDLYRISPIRRL